MRKLSWLIPSLALVAAGCVKEKMPSEYTLDFEVKTASFAADGQEPVLSPVGAGTTLGIWFFGAEGTTLLDNARYTVTAEGVVSGIRSESPGGFSAVFYTPRQETAADPSAVPFTHGDDVLWGSVEADNSITPLAVMSHLCPQVTFEVRDADENPVSGASIEVAGFFDGATLDMKTGTMTTSTTATAKITSRDTPTCVFASRAGMPHRLHATILLDTVAQIPEDFYESDIEHLLKPGISYLFTLTLPRESNTPVTVTATVIPWVDGGESNAEVE